MRTMIRIAMTDTVAANKALKEGMIPKLVQQTSELIKPEAAYFTADKGFRTAYFFCDITDSTQIPQIAEPWFTNVNATVELMPVMNGDDLKAGLAKTLK